VLEKRRSWLKKWRDTMLRFYFAVGWTAFQRQLVYRWANFAGLLTNIFFGAIFSYVIVALYQARPVVNGYGVIDSLRYTWLVQALIMVVLPFSWYDLMQTIRSGEVVSDLSKPCDFYWYWFSREVGRNLYYLLFRTVPIYGAGMLLFGIGLPDQWLSWLAFALSLPLGAMLGIAYRFLYNVIAFWVLEARAIALLAGVVALFFTGSYVPLPLFPDWLRMIANWLPFNGLLSLPAEVFMGKVAANALWFELARQGCWVVLLTLVVRLVSSIATRRVIAQGG
jgi:ABC-2 type transport system permease protein